MSCTKKPDTVPVVVPFFFGFFSNGGSGSIRTNSSLRCNVSFFFPKTNQITQLMSLIKYQKHSPNYAGENPRGSDISVLFPDFRLRELNEIRDMKRQF